MDQNRLDPHPPAAQKPFRIASFGVDPHALLMLAIARWKYLARFVGAGAAFAFVMCLLTTSTFTAYGSLRLDPRLSQRLQFSPNAREGSSTPDTLGIESDTQAEVVKSEQVATRVIRQLKLVDDPDFNRPANYLLWFVGAARSAVTGIFRSRSDSENGAMRETIENFSDLLDVKRVPQTMVIGVSFRAKSAERAAEITNAVMQQTIEELLQSQIEATRATAGWLQARLVELQKAALDTDRALQRSRFEASEEKSAEERLMSMVTIREFERQATAARIAYEGFLERYKAATAQETYPISDLRILSVAAPPRLKSQPKTVLFTLLGAVAGLLAGVGVLVWRNPMPDL